MENESTIYVCDNRELVKAKEVSEQQSGGGKVREYSCVGLRAIRITSDAQPHFAVSETALFPASLSSAAISEGEKMTIEH